MSKDASLNSFSARSLANSHWASGSLSLLEESTTNTTACKKKAITKHFLLGNKGNFVNVLK
jgi:hypothetical protein